MHDYQLKEEIGRGNFSCVYKGRKRNSIDFYAIYSIEKCKRQRVIDRVNIWRNMNDPSVIKFYNWYETANHLWLITELCTGGDLRTILANKTILKQENLKLLGGDIVAGLFYIHSKGYVYRDLKPSNLLMDSTASLRFYDFGLACPFNEVNSRPLIGTPLYMAPELFLEGKGNLSTIASDLWSLGCVLYEMAAGQPPFDGDDLGEVLTNILTQPLRQIAGMSGPLQMLITQLLEKNPLKRATWKDVLASSFWDNAFSDWPLDVLPPQPVLEGFRNCFDASSSQPWSKDEWCSAVERAVAASKANLRAPVTGNKDHSACDEMISLLGEIDFSPISVEPTTSQRHMEHSPDNGTPSEDKTSNVLPLPLTMHCSEGAALIDDNQPFSSLHRENYPLCEARPTDHPAYTLMKQRGQRIDNTSTESPSDDCLLGESFGELSVRILSCIPIGDLLWCSSDNSTRPLWGNPHIESAITPIVDESMLSFTAHNLSTVKKMDEREFGSFLKSIYASFTTEGRGAMELENTLKYLESITHTSTVANLIVNSSIMTYCIGILGAEHVPSSCRAQAASLVGRLLRHASYLSPAVAKANILSRLLAYFHKETRTLVVRKLIICIGELVFYIFSHKDSELAQWNLVPADIHEVFLSALQKNDNKTQHYAVKALENMAEHFRIDADFYTYSLIERLLALYATAPLNNKHMRSSALCAALRIAANHDGFIFFVLSSKNFPCESAMVALGNVFSAAWATSSVPPCAALRSASMSTCDAETVCRVIVSMSGDILEFVGEGVGDRTSAPLRGKLMLYMLLLGTLGRSVFLKVCTPCHMALADRIAGEEDTYIQQCTAAFVTYLDAYVAETLKAMSHGAPPNSMLRFSSSLQCILRTTILRQKLRIGTEVFEDLSRCLKNLADNSLPKSCEEDLDSLMNLFVLDREVVAQYYESIFATIVPLYTKMLHCKQDKHRFVAVHFLMSLMDLVASDHRVARNIDSTLGSAVLSIVSSTKDILHDILDEPMPIPAHTMRLLVACAEWNVATLAMLATESSVLDIMNYMKNVSDVCLFHSLSLVYAVLRAASCEGLVALVLREKISIIVNQVSVAAMNENMEQLLEVCCALTELILRSARADQANHTGSQCLSFAHNDLIRLVYLPLCSYDNPIATHAASVVYELCFLSSSLQCVVFSAVGQNALLEVLTKSPMNTEAAEFLMKAFMYACGKQRQSNVKQLVKNRTLLDALKTAADGNLQSISLNARKLLSIITK